MHVILTLLSAIAILVWGARTVQKGVLRAYGELIRRALGKCVSKKYTAFIGGALTTCLTQSSNATAMMANSFAAQGLLGLQGALAIALGADAGSALMAKILTMDLSWFGPVLLIIGVWLMVKYKNRSADVGQALTGLGLMLLALSMIIQTAQPIFQTNIARELLESMTTDIGLNILIGVGLALLSYSSLAATLLIATLAATGAISLESALEVSVGATIGSGLLAMMSGNSAGGVSKQSAIGGFIFKSVGACIVLPFTGVIANEAVKFGMKPLEIVVNFHLGWNFIRTIIQLFFVGSMAKLMEKIIPNELKEQDEKEPKYLEKTALESPSLALINAGRETIRMSDYVQNMVNGLPLLMGDKAHTSDAKSLRENNKIVDSLYLSIRNYLMQLSGLEGKESVRWAQIMQWSIIISQAGDVLHRIIRQLENEKIEKRLSFSNEGKQELLKLTEEIKISMNLAMAVFIDQDPKTAAELLKQKDIFRSLEHSFSQAHFARLSKRKIPTIETSSLHLDVMNNLKGFNSLICSIAVQSLQENKENSEPLFSKDEVEKINKEKLEITGEEE